MAGNIFPKDDLLPPVFDTAVTPSYLPAADNHNIANASKSWFDPTTWDDRVANGFKFASVSIFSGAAQLYNSAISITNWAGLSDIQSVQIDKAITNFDNDLGKYYQENQQGADLVGFIGSSLLPGIGGIKLFNAGQKSLSVAAASGKLGTNLSKATGLLVPKTANYVEAAAHELNAASASFNTITQNGLKAIGTKFHQNVLEGVAFEVAVQAGLNASPILEDQTYKDITTNLLLTIPAFSAAQTAFQIPGVRKAIKDLTSKFEKDTKFTTGIDQGQPVGSDSIDIIRKSKELEGSASLIPPGPNATAKEIELYQTLKGNVEYRQERIRNDIRTSTNNLAIGGDKSATNLLADVFGYSNSDSVTEAMLFANQVSRVAVDNSVDKVKRIIAQNPDIPEYAELGTLYINHYIKILGEDAGNVLDEVPKVLNLADKVGDSATKSLPETIHDLLKDKNLSLMNSSIQER